jgi:hypothetical protein
LVDNGRLACMNAMNQVSSNVSHKRVAHTSESRTPPTLITCKALQLNHHLR